MHNKNIHDEKVVDVFVFWENQISMVLTFLPLRA